MAENSLYYIGIDVGGTSVKEGLFDEEGNLLGKVSVPTPPLTDEAGFAAVTNGIEQLMAAAQQSMLFVRGIGLAVPCPVPASGLITMAANITIDPTGLKEAIEERCPHATVRYVNDANAAAMGELWRGSAEGHRSMVMVTIGTGLGGGVVLNGDVVDGAFGAGGEIGHIRVNPDETRICGCGLRGCLEQYASATGVVNNYLLECEARGVEPLELTGPSDSLTVFNACRAGDEVARAAIDTMVEYLSRGLQIVSAVVDPEVYVLGGGTSASADLFLEQLCDRYAARAFPASANTPIEVAKLGNDAGIFGAAYVALRSVVREA
ncbi:ROK family protein [Collinsella provencensis]|uniref:ROK family protein n=1 Tax=Collinsella provencensis TaxID=1937461 RepID=UPI000C8245D4|nr:ROK family protein [Collinsella provencensis]